MTKKTSGLIITSRKSISKLTSKMSIGFLVYLNTSYEIMAVEKSHQRVRKFYSGGQIPLLSVRCESQVCINPVIVCGAARVKLNNIHRIQ